MLQAHTQHAHWLRKRYGSSARNHWHLRHSRGGAHSIALARTGTTGSLALQTDREGVLPHREANTLGDVETMSVSVQLRCVQNMRTVHWHVRPQRLVQH